MALYADAERGRYPIWQSLDHEGFFPGSGILFTTVTVSCLPPIPGCMILTDDFLRETLQNESRPCLINRSKGKSCRSSDPCSPTSPFPNLSISSSQDGIRTRSSGDLSPIGLRPLRANIWTTFGLTLVVCISLERRRVGNILASHFCL